MKERRASWHEGSVKRWVAQIGQIGSWVLGLALLAWCLRAQPLAQMLAAVRRIGPAALLTPIVALGWHACNTFAFRALLDGEVSWAALFRNRLIGDGYNNLLPFAGVGGEPWKGRDLARHLPPARIVAALIRDRTIETSFGLVFTAVCLAASMRSVSLPALLRSALWLFAAGALVAGAAGFALVRSALPGRAGGAMARWLGAPTPGVPGTVDRVAWPRLLRVVAWHLPARALGLVEVAILLHALGMPVALPFVVFIDNLLNAAGFVGFAIPQGLGVLEGTSVFAFGLIGGAGPAAIAFALARRGRLAVVSLVGVLLHVGGLLFGRRSRMRPPCAWDAEYARGHWDYLDSARELGHYALIAGFIHQLSERPRVLDVGCGHGRLYRLLGTLPMASYLGIDLSVEAIGRADAIRGRGDDHEFRVADFERAPPAGPFDVVVFNESIYYAAEPRQAFERYLGLLSAGGILIVSIRDLRKNRSVRAALRRAQRPIHTATVRNGEGERWTVDVFFSEGVA